MIFVKMLPTIMGTLLILVGIGLVCHQVFWMGTLRDDDAHHGRHDEGIKIDAGITRWRAQAPHPGLILIIVGAFLLSVGAFSPH